MNTPSLHLFIKNCHKPWRSPLFRSIVVINQRQFSSVEHENKDSKRKDNEILPQSQNNHIQIATFTQKGIRLIK